MTRGVLPLPPATRLPTTMTGIPGCSLGSRRILKKIFLKKTMKPKTRLTGHSSQATAPRRYQCFTGFELLVGLRGERDLRQAREARRLHDAHHRLMGGGRIGPDHHDRVLQGDAAAPHLPAHLPPPPPHNRDPPPDFPPLRA